jgi:hypothetical protein
MKRMILCAGILLLMSASAQPQTKSRKARQTVQSRTVSSNKTAKKTSDTSAMVTLNTTANYPAKANTGKPAAYDSKLVITDPIITALDARAHGANIKFNNSGIVGVPKRAYGFANGHITLKTTGAVTTGTQTGSGAVATGTSLGTFGSLGPAMEVNGKNPYAGTIMWGNILGMYLPKADSINRPVRLKNY